MKKLLYLFLAITIACGGDDDSNSNNSIYTVKYEVTTTALIDADENWACLYYTNSTGNENSTCINESLWELQIQIDPEAGSYVVLDVSNYTDEGLATAKIYVNGDLKGESFAEEGSDPYVVYYFPFQP